MRNRAAVVRKPYQWEKDFEAAAGKPTETDPKWERLVERAFRDWERDPWSLHGWKMIAGFMIWNERNARRAYREWAEFRQCIRKHGGRYVADPALLMNLQHEFLCRREGRRGRIEFARSRQRQSGGQFS